YPIETVPVSEFCTGGTGAGSTVIAMFARATSGLLGVSSPHEGSSSVESRTRARREVLVLIAASGLRGGRRQLGRLAARAESHAVVRAVAERLLGRLPAAAKRDHRAAGETPFLAALVEDRDGSFEAERTVVPDRDLEIGHEAIILVVPSRGLNS